MFEKEAEEYRAKRKDCQYFSESYKNKIEKGFKDGAEFGYNKAKEEIQVQEYSYENGVFKCKYKTGKIFESVDGKTWKEEKIE